MVYNPQIHVHLPLLARMASGLSANSATARADTTQENPLNPERESRTVSLSRSVPGLGVLIVRRVSAARHRERGFYPVREISRS